MAAALRAAAPALTTRSAAARLSSKAAVAPAAVPTRVARPQRAARMAAAAFFGGSAVKTADAPIYGFTVTDVDGRKLAMSKFKGKVLLVVNVASACGFTPQYGGMAELVNSYGKRGLEVLAFPCNQFGGQEPGSNSDVKKFAAGTGFKGVLLGKVNVNGPDAEPLFQYLKSEKKGLLTSDVKWNFSKFLVDREGNVVGRYPPTTTPEAIAKDIEALL